ncbi:MAG: hypothetical protein AABW56_05045 [Nanoarchaeota archaeon]
MKKTLLLIITLSILLINLVNAQSEGNLNVLRENYYFGETIQSNLFVNITTVDKITQEKLFLINQNNQEIPTSMFLEKISNSYYFIYFNLPELFPGFYRLELRNVRYIDETDGILKELTLQDQFSISNNTNISVSINPGIIIKNSLLEITNNAFPINITIEAPPYTNLSKSYKLIVPLKLNVRISDEDYNIKLFYEDVYYNIQVINLNKNLIENTTEVQPTPPINSILFSNSTLGNYFPKEIILDKKSSIYNPFYIKNTWNYTLDNITIKVSGILAEVLVLDKNNFESIDNGETIKIIASINQNKNPRLDNYLGSITVTSLQNTVSYLSLGIRFASPEPNLTKNETIIQNITKKNETINQIPPKNDKKSSLGIVTIILAILLILFLIYLIAKKKFIRTESFEEHFYKFKR